MQPSLYKAQGNNQFLHYCDTKKRTKCSILAGVILIRKAKRQEQNQKVTLIRDYFAIKLAVISLFARRYCSQFRKIFFSLRDFFVM